MDDLNGGCFHRGFFFFGVRGGNKEERKKEKNQQPNPNTEINQICEGNIFSFFKKRKEKRNKIYWTKKGIKNLNSLCKLS